MDTTMKTILITGTNRGLGLSIATYCLTMGHRVVSLIRSRGERIGDLEKEYPDRHCIISCDVTEEKQIDRAYADVKEKIPSLDILINNAAVHLEQHKPGLMDTDFSVYLPTFRINAVAPLMVTRRFLPLLMKGTGKLVVNISSEAGSIGNAYRKGEYSYCMSKAALNMASKILQNSVADDGIKVLAIHPGWFSSDMGGKEAPITPDDAAQTVVETIMRKWDSTGPVYIDPEGKEMSW